MTTQYVKCPKDDVNSFVTICYFCIDVRYTHTVLVLTSQHYLAKLALALKYSYS